MNEKEGLSVPRRRRSWLDVALVLTVVSAPSGCALKHEIFEPEPGGPGPTSLQADSLSLRWSAGECVGYCEGTTEIGSTLQGTYTEMPWQPDAAYPPKVEPVTVTAADWQAIQALAHTALGITWQPSYGCPDCGDWGGWRLTIQTSDGRTRTTTLDNHRSENPPALEQLLEAVHALTPDKPLAPG